MPDFSAGFPVGDLADGGMIQGTAGGEDVMLARRGDEFFAVSAFCSHYHGPLAEGLEPGLRRRGLGGEAIQPDAGLFRYSAHTLPTASVSS